MSSEEVKPLKPANQNNAGKSAHKRFASNYVLSANLSKGYYLHVFIGGLVFLGMLLLYASRLLADINFIISGLPDLALANSVHDRLFTLALLFFFCFVAFIFCTTFYIIMLSQRVGGPVVAIVAYIRELKKGNYDAQRHLRKNDELVPIMLELQELAKTLKAQRK